MKYDDIEVAANKKRLLDWIDKDFAKCSDASILSLTPNMVFNDSHVFVIREKIKPVCVALVRQYYKEMRERTVAELRALGVSL
jgi:hypothetical protein